MLESPYSGPFEEPQASEGQMSTTVVDADQPAGGDEFSITTTGAEQPDALEETDASLDVTTDVGGMSFIDGLLVDTSLTRSDVELMLQAVYVVVTVAALYHAMEGS